MTELPRWVLHHHLVPRPHRDLRLELDGALASWAVPRGMPPSGTQNRLAVQVPDHDLDHLAYTDEHKSIEDTGTFVAHERTAGKLVVTLQGARDAVTYALMATQPPNWLLHRMSQTDPRHLAAVALLAELEAER